VRCSRFVRPTDCGLRTAHCGIPRRTRCYAGPNDVAAGRSNPTLGACLTHGRQWDFAGKASQRGGYMFTAGRSRRNASETVTAT
jgi:hypothetical protein